MVAACRDEIRLLRLPHLPALREAGRCSRQLFVVDFSDVRDDESIRHLSSSPPDGSDGSDGFFHHLEREHPLLARPLAKHFDPLSPQVRREPR